MYPSNKTGGDSTMPTITADDAMVDPIGRKIVRRSANCVPQDRIMPSTIRNAISNSAAASRRGKRTGSIERQCTRTGSRTCRRPRDCRELSTLGLRNLLQCACVPWRAFAYPLPRKPPKVNLKKVLIAVAALALVIVGWKFLTRVDRSNPLAVAAAFTKALKAQDTATASGYYVPDRAEAWRTATDDTLRKMRSGTMERFFEGIPSKPVFASVTNAGTASDKMTVKSEDSAITLDMSHVSGKWYVAKSPI